MTELNHYSQLIGYTVTKAEYETVEEEDGDHWETDPMICLTMENKEGAKLSVFVSQDEEGNGPGYLFIEGF